LQAGISRTTEENFVRVKVAHARVIKQSLEISLCARWFFFGAWRLRFGVGR
jgi:hypothetical protein